MRIYQLFMTFYADTVIIGCWHDGQTVDGGITATVLAADICGETGNIESNAVLKYDARNDYYIYKLHTVDESGHEQVVDVPVSFGDEDICIRATHRHSNAAWDMLAKHLPVLNSNSFAPWKSAFISIIHNLNYRAKDTEYITGDDDEFILEGILDSRTILKVDESCEDYLHLYDINEPEQQFRFTEDENGIQLLNETTGELYDVKLSARNGLRLLTFKDAD